MRKVNAKCIKHYTGELPHPIAFYFDLGERMQQIVEDVKHNHTLNYIKNQEI